MRENTRKIISWWRSQIDSVVYQLVESYWHICQQHTTRLSWGMWWYEVPILEWGIYNIYSCIYNCRLCMGVSIRPSVQNEVYNNKHLDWPEGNSEFCFPRISMFPETKSREISRISHSEWWQHISSTFFRREKKRSLKNAPSTRRKHQSYHDHATSCHALITCASGQQCTVTLWRQKCCPLSQMLPARGRLAGNSLFVRCHVTMNQPMNARVILGKTPAI